MKKSICIFLAALALSASLTFFAGAGDMPTIPLKPTRVAGDVNSDGNVDLRDVVILTRYLAGGWNVNVNTKNADVNADGKADLKDTVLIRRYLAGGWGVSLK